MTFIEEYHSKIVSGEIVVSKKVRKQMEKLVVDIHNPGRFHFDEEKANRPIIFIETFTKQSKGRWGGLPLNLELFQKAILQAIFGFIDDNGNRRYREALIIMGRKNGKSCLLSAIALYMMFADHEAGASVVAVASKKDQAKIVFDETKNMVMQSPLLSKHIHKRKSDLYVPITFSTFAPLASDSNTLDGLNIHCGIIDELHTLKDRNLYDVLKQSTSAREQPLVFIITTSGFVRENIYDSLYEYANDVLEGNNKDERFISFIYELDERKEWTDEKAWQKANPGLGSIKSLDYMYENVQRAKDDPSFLPTLMTKDFNIRETGVGSWLTFEQVSNPATYNIEDLGHSYAVGGVDLSSVGDLTCASVLIKKQGQLYLTQMYFIPEATAKRKEQEDKVPYVLWETQGWIRFCVGNKVNYKDVTAWFKELRDEYQILTLWVGYDSWNSTFWVDEMKSNGFQMEEVIQGAKTMSSPMKLLAADLDASLINYNNNPILKWCLTNTQIEIDKNENIRPVKGRNQKQRIDGAVSLVDAYVIYNRHFEDYCAYCNDR